LTPVAPRYPDALHDASATGTVSARVTVNRGGGVDAVQWESLAGTHDIFGAAVTTFFRKLQFRPARTIGIPHAAQLNYLIRFVVIRPERPLNKDERLVGGDSLPSRCPDPAVKNQIVVCATATPYQVRSAH
jgi:TonB family protein